ncbi:MAG: prepilin-type N-terminal cleavage/methylation domain-containing protein [Candidatus Zixiibacteriota bacterium]|nr:MAG: prepilin-type N-terminal cleavage/methylation domain-containing protein [candidate division Zixibacteria bacterium]
MSAQGTRGFTLVELVIIILILAIVSTVAITKLSNTFDTAQAEHTKHELDELARAIVGTPELYTNGARSEFGYVGDVGSLPPNLDALVANPGGYTTWDGPYIATGFAPDDFKQDGWGVDYTYSDTLLRSTGSGTNIDKVFATSSAALLANSIEGTVIDADQSLPGSTYADSIVVRLSYPDGAGGTAAVAVNTDSRGYFSISNLPIGNHVLQVVYIPDSDTVTLPVSLNPGLNARLDIVFPADLW